MTGVDHQAEVDALGRRFPGWTIWFGPFTGRWWALPPKDRDVGDFLEADTPQRLIARIEVVKDSASRRPAVRHGRSRPSRDPRDSRPDVRRPSNLRRLEGVTPSPLGRVPAIAWPGSTAR
ncbi:hypothetical protein ACFOY4_14830 [Actinomadura syzygii]|uniref:Uncharacterized protein n=1 Tax=Actinomadura syzygii TaxID=1427538 RepID=A0A5D0U246_9ACTN|nr:hypothetical protein [Actinomadura syzygii]TYC11736.1 hypothetical protein FXF65_27045 [Actinomadura syzygii]